MNLFPIQSSGPKSSSPPSTQRRTAKFYLLPPLSKITLIGTTFPVCGVGGLLPPFFPPSPPPPPSASSSLFGRFLPAKKELEVPISWATKGRRRREVKNIGCLRADDSARKVKVCEIGIAAAYAAVAVDRFIGTIKVV